jgi:serine/threonine protein kinase
MIFQEKSNRSGGGGERVNKFSQDLFRVVEILGKGGFGKVMKVEFKRNKKIYAMKEMSKCV